MDVKAENEGIKDLLIDLSESAVPGRNLPIRLPMFKKESLSLSESKEVALEVARGLGMKRDLIPADAEFDEGSDFGPVVCDARDWEDVDEAQLPLGSTLLVLCRRAEEGAAPIPCWRIDSITSISPRGSMMPLAGDGSLKPARMVLRISGQKKRKPRKRIYFIGRPTFVQV